ncbi:MAG: SDR family oxidoreductase [Pseudomonadota bacterium]
MNIFLTGATGFIGHRLAQALLEAGHDLTCAVRDPQRLNLEPGRGAVHAVALDFATSLSADDWLAHMANADVVINTVGIFREAPGQGFELVHTRAPRALFDACASARTPLVIQLSALGADAHAASEFHRSKKAADDHLRSLPVRSVIAQPSLVYGPRGASAELFNLLACLPVLLLPRPDGPVKPVQPVHLDDVVEGLCRLATEPPAGRQTLALVGPEPLSLEGYLLRLRRSLGITQRQWVLHLPAAWFRWGARLAGRLPGSLVDEDSVNMLLRGNAAPSDEFARVLERFPRPPEAFVSRSDASLLRRSALLSAWVPPLRWSIAAVWIWTGIVSLGLYPVEDSLGLLARVGVHGAMALLMLYGAAILDLAFGIATLALRGELRRWLWVAQALLIVGYTLIISWRLPEYWLHPYGPVLKNLPMLAAIALLHAFEESTPGRGKRA